MPEWTLFTDKWPEEGREVTIVWTWEGKESPNSETDCVWTNEGLDWNCITIPYKWKYL